MKERNLLVCSTRTSPAQLRSVASSQTPSSSASRIHLVQSQTEGGPPLGRRSQAAPAMLPPLQQAPVLPPLLLPAGGLAGSPRLPAEGFAGHLPLLPSPLVRCWQDHRRACLAGLGEPQVAAHPSLAALHLSPQTARQQQLRQPPPPPPLPPAVGRRRSGGRWALTLPGAARCQIRSPHCPSRRMRLAGWGWAPRCRCCC